MRRGDGLCTRARVLRGAEQCRCHDHAMQHAEQRHRQHGRRLHGQRAAQDSRLRYQRQRQCSAITSGCDGCDRSNGVNASFRQQCARCACSMRSTPQRTLCVPHASTLQHEKMQRALYSMACLVQHALYSVGSQWHTRSAAVRVRLNHPIPVPRRAVSSRCPALLCCAMQCSYASRAIPAGPVPSQPAPYHPSRPRAVPCRTVPH